MTEYDPIDYENKGKRYVVNAAEKWKKCHLYNGDEFLIKSVGGNSFTIEYFALTSPQNARDPLQKFWESVGTLTYRNASGILEGSGDDKLDGGGARTLSIALDRSKKDPYVVHIYVGKRGGNPTPPDDGSATGTGK